MSVENLVLGRGKIYFAPYYPGTTSGGTKGYLGNTPELTMASTNTKLDHYSSESGLKVKNRSVLLQVDLNLTFSTDNISPANLLLWFGGKSSGTQPVDAPTDLGTLTLIGASSAIFGSLFFESDNPVGNNQNFWFPYVSLTPNGNYALKGDAWQTLSFTAESLKRDASTERFYAYQPLVGSTAGADINPNYLTVDSVSFATGGSTPATGGTVTAPANETHGTQATIGYTNTGGTVSWLFYNDGTNNFGNATVASGASGNVSILVPAAGTYTVNAYNNPNGTGTPLDKSGSVTVS